MHYREKQRNNALYLYSRENQFVRDNRTKKKTYNYLQGRKKGTTNFDRREWLFHIKGKTKTKKESYLGKILNQEPFYVSSDDFKQHLVAKFGYVAPMLQKDFCDFIATQLVSYVEERSGFLLQEKQFIKLNKGYLGETTMKNFKNSHNNLNRKQLIKRYRDLGLPIDQYFLFIYLAQFDSNLEIEFKENNEVELFTIERIDAIDLGDTHP